MAWPPAASTRLRTRAACASGFGGTRGPDQPAAPIVDDVAAGLARQGLAERAARGRRAERSATPARRRARRRRQRAGRRGSCPRPRPRRRLRASRRRRSSPPAWSARPRGLPLTPRCLPAAAASPPAPARRARPGRRRSGRNAELGRCAAPDTSKGEPSAAVMARLAGDVVEPAQQQRALAFRPRHHLQRHLGHDRRACPRSRPAACRGRSR